MKFLIIGDLHGNKPKIHFKDYDAIIAPGDFCSDALRKYMFKSLQMRLKDPKTAVSWYDLAGREKAAQMIKKSIADGRKILEYLNSLDVPVYTVPGNWDWTPEPDADWAVLRKDHWKNLKKGLENIIDVHHTRVDAGDYEIIGHGIWSGPEYPQDKKMLKKLSAARLSEIRKVYANEYRTVDTLFNKAEKTVVFMPHNVPYNTPIDKITDKSSPRYGQHFGSLIARQMVDKYQPLVCVGGHMHEHFKAAKLGKTTCINAGFGSYVNVLLELEGNKIKKLEFYKGK